MAQNNTTTSATADNEVTHFIKKAAMMDMKEIKAGKMAQEKAVNPQVRSFGEMMVKDHTNSSAELKTIAGRKNITLPMDYSPMSNAGASSNMQMGTTGQHTYSGTISERSLRGTKGMKLSKAQTTPSRKYYNGTPTYWTDKNVNKTARTSSSNWSENSGTSNTNSMGISGQAMTSGTVNSNTSVTTTTADEPGVSSSGNVGVSGTTGTLTANAEFNGATMGPDRTTSTTNSSTTNQNSGTTTSSQDVPVGTTTHSMDTGTGVSQNTGTGTMNTTTGTGTGTTSQSMSTGSTDMSLIDMEDDHKNKLSRLSTKTGTEFDREYMDLMEDGHNRAIDLYEDAAKSSDADISAFANKMLPKLRQHREQAKTIKSSINKGL